MISYDVSAWGKPLQQAIRDTPTPTGTEVWYGSSTVVYATRMYTFETATLTWAAVKNSRWKNAA